MATNREMTRNGRPRPVPCAYPGCTVKEARYGEGSRLFCARHSHAIAVDLTKEQMEWVRWALDGPISEWDDPEDLAYSHDITIDEARMAILARDAIGIRDWSDTLMLPDWAGLDNAVMDDLLNMLEDVAPDVANGYGYEDELARGRSPETAKLVVSQKAACARNAAEKIRKAIAR